MQAQEEIVSQLRGWSALLIIGSGENRTPVNGFGDHRFTTKLQTLFKTQSFY